MQRVRAVAEMRNRTIQRLHQRRAARLEGGVLGCLAVHFIEAERKSVFEICANLASISLGQIVLLKQRGFAYEALAHDAVAAIAVFQCELMAVVTTVGVEREKERRRRVRSFTGSGRLGLCGSGHVRRWVEMQTTARPLQRRVAGACGSVLYRDWGQEKESASGEQAY